VRSRHQSISVGMLLTIVVMGLVGCDSSALSRGKAESLIDRLDFFRSEQKRVEISRDEAIQLVSKGFCHWEGIGISHLALSPAGSKYFTGVGGEIMTNPNPFTARLFVMVMKPLRPSITEVTGITDLPIPGGKIKVVEYQWKWESGGQSDDLKKIVPSLVLLHNRQAMFQLYDDGWRLIKDCGEVCLNQRDRREFQAQLHELNQDEITESTQLLSTS
jgi:hypothetical protein